MTGQLSSGALQTGSAVVTGDLTATAGTATVAGLKAASLDVTGNAKVRGRKPMHGHAWVQQPAARQMEDALDRQALRSAPAACLLPSIVTCGITKLDGTPPCAAGWQERDMHQHHGHLLSHRGRYKQLL